MTDTRQILQDHFEMCLIAAVLAGKYLERDQADPNTLLMLLEPVMRKIFPEANDADLAEVLQQTIICVAYTMNALNDSKEVIN